MNPTKRFYEGRTKPILPKELEIFRILYNKLEDLPLGPAYIGNFEFEIERIPFELVQLIREESSLYSVLDMTRLIIKDYGIRTRAEYIAGLYPKDKTIKYWPSPEKSQMLKQHEKNYIRRKKGSEEVYRCHYKPFIIWCIENGYEYFQIGLVLNRAPDTLRMWANNYGYKKFDRVVTRVADLTGKVDRRESLVADFIEVTQDMLKTPNPFSNHEMVGRDLRLWNHDPKRVMQLGIDFAKPGTKDRSALMIIDDPKNPVNEITMEQAMDKLTSLGFKVTLEKVA